MTPITSQITALTKTIHTKVTIRKTVITIITFLTRADQDVLEAGAPMNKVLDDSLAAIDMDI